MLLLMNNNTPTLVFIFQRMCTRKWLDVFCLASLLIPHTEVCNGTTTSSATVALVSYGQCVYCAARSSHL